MATTSEPMPDRGSYFNAEQQAYLREQREAADAAADLAARAELERENERLKQQALIADGVEDNLVDDNNRLRAENDQLRSVVYEMVQPTINAAGESWLFDLEYADQDRATLTTTFGALRRARQVFPAGMFHYKDPAPHPFVLLSGSQDASHLYTRCGVVGCATPPEGHPK